jgi:lipopolysaccharide transport system permease protein
VNADGHDEHHRPTARKARPRSRPVPPAAHLVPALQQAFRERELLAGLVQRDLRARYRRTVIGWGWSLLNPAAMTVVYTVVFVYFLKVTPEPGDPSGMTSYTVFLLAGLLPWNLVTGGATQGMGALMSGAPLISKVRFAREHLVLAAVLSLASTLMIELGVVMFIALALGFVTFQLAPVLILLVVLLTLFAAGVALLLAAANLRYRDVQHITGVGFMVWFYLTPIIYPISSVPERVRIVGMSLPARTVLELNPMARFAMAFRNCLFDVRLPGVNTLVGLTAMSGATFVFGYRYFTRRAPWFAEEL